MCRVFVRRRRWSAADRALGWSAVECEFGSARTRWRDWPVSTHTAFATGLHRWLCVRDAGPSCICSERSGREVSRFDFTPGEGTNPPRQRILVSLDLLPFVVIPHFLVVIPTPLVVI